MTFGEANENAVAAVVEALHAQNIKNFDTIHVEEALIIIDAESFTAQTHGSTEINRRDLEMTIRPRAKYILREPCGHCFCQQKN